METKASQEVRDCMIERASAKRNVKCANLSCVAFYQITVQSDCSIFINAPAQPATSVSHEIKLFVTASNTQSQRGEEKKSTNQSKPQPTNHLKLSQVYLLFISIICNNFSRKKTKAIETSKRNPIFSSLCFDYFIIRACHQLCICMRDLF